MKIPRWMHRAWAFVNGYFWLPCPNCGRDFGGHERPNGVLKIVGDRGLVTCPHCPGTYGDGPPDDFWEPTTLDDLPTDELEALYELTGIQRADQTSRELHRARKWLSDAVYERRHGPIKFWGERVAGQMQVFTGSIGGEMQTDEANDFVTPPPRKAANKPEGGKS